MLPACRTQGRSAPSRRLISPLVMWRDSLMNSSIPCPIRSVLHEASPASIFHSMVGQCSTLERKSIEPMALRVAGGNIRGMQRCMKR